MSKINKTEAISALNDVIDLQKKKDEFIVFIPSKKDFTEDDLMKKEYDLLGYYLTKHPLDNYKTKLELSDKIGNLSDYQSGKSINVCGIITEKKVIQTKAGKTMAFLQVEDLTGRIEVVVFATTFEKNKASIIDNGMVEISGKVEIEESENDSEEEIIANKKAKILAMGIKPLQEVSRINKLILKLSCKEDLGKIVSIIKNKNGNIPIFIEYDDFLLETSFRISQNSDVLNEIRELCLTKEIKE